MLKLELIESFIRSNSGIELDVNLDLLPDKELATIRPLGFPKNRGIYLTSALKWRTLITKLEFEDYSQEIVDNILSSSIRIGIFKELVDSIQEKDKRRKITLELDESKGRIIYQIEQSPIDLTKDVAENYLAIQCLDILNTILVFFEVKEQETIELEGLPEGAKIRVETNRYERSSINRSLCIDYFGAYCQACGFDFYRIYGKIGKGFIHVHHIIPVCELGENYIINPIKDLIPLCPNCHTMVHTTSPPIAPEELREIIAKYKSVN